MPNNEWYAGKHYDYNQEQDKNIKKIKNQIAASTFVENEDYDDDGYSTIPTEFRYKHYTRKLTREEYAAGARRTTSTNQISTSNETIIFKINDRIRLINQSDDETPKKIMDFDNSQNTPKSMATLLLPGLHKEYTSTLVITLK